MKGEANWILIIGSVIIGITIFTIGANLFVRQIKVNQRQSVLAEIQDFHTKLTNVCNMGLGGRYDYVLTLTDNVKAVYVSYNQKNPPPDKVSEMITNRENSFGNNTCVQFFEDNLPICQYIGCEAQMTFMGSPSMKSTLQTIIAKIKGGHPVYQYKVTIEKTRPYFLKVESSPLV